MNGRVAPLWLVGLVAVAATCTLIHNTRARVKPLSQLEYAEWVDGQVYSMASWRYWDDMYVAISRYMDWTDGPKSRPADPDTDVAAFRDMLVAKTGEAGIRATEFWRTVKPAAFRPGRNQTWIPPLEDPGRPILLAAAFRLLRGVAPYLLVWIGTLASIPILLWILWEARAGGAFLAGAVFVALCVSSPFVVETLSLPHSAAGFYLIGGLLLVALGFHAFLGTDRSVRGFAVRAVATSLAFALCCACRGSTLAMGPAFGVALFASMRRAFPRVANGHWARQCALAGLLTAAFLAPYLAFRPAQHHNAWMGIWQGLGDYASDRGYSWHDRDLKRWLVAHGRKPFEHPRFVTSGDEAFMRETVLRDIRADPAFFVGVLGRRFVETVSLAKLGPYGPWDGYSIEPPPLHYKYTTPVDWFGFGRRKIELPTAVFWMGPAALLAWWAAAAWRSDDELKRYLEDRLALVLTVALAALPLPVLMTTAAGIETETFALAHSLGFALLGQRIADGLPRVAGDEEPGARA